MTTFRTKDDVLTLLVHLGYLAYDKKTQEVYIPNKEIASEFMNAMDEPAWDGVIQAIAQSKTLLDATLTLDADTVAALLIELKWSKSAETAIRQIKDKEYVETLKNYTGDILLVGINYDKKSKEHQCIIERYKV